MFDCYKDMITASKKTMWTHHASAKGMNALTQETVKILSEIDSEKTHQNIINEIAEQVKNKQQKESE